MIVKKYIIAKTINEEVIKNIVNTNNNSCCNSNNFGFNLNFLSGIITHFQPLTIVDLLKGDPFLTNVEFDTEKEAMIVLEKLYINMYNSYEIRYTILPMYLYITDETEIRRLKSKEILSEED
jgi:hypothetical protein